MASSYNPPCAACKLMRRKCVRGCIYSPHFPPEDPDKFANIHKVFGASHMSKLLNELPPHQRRDAVNSMAYEAEARVRDPVYGCAGAISLLQRQVERLQEELDEANLNLIRFAFVDIPPPVHMAAPHGSDSGGRFYQTLGMPYDAPWGGDIYNTTHEGGMGGSN